MGGGGYIALTLPFKAASPHLVIGGARPSYHTVMCLEGSHGRPVPPSHWETCLPEPQAERFLAVRLSKGHCHAVGRAWCHGPMPNHHSIDACTSNWLRCMVLRSMPPAMGVFLFAPHLTAPMEHLLMRPGALMPRIAASPATARRSHLMTLANTNTRTEQPPPYGPQRLAHVVPTTPLPSCRGTLDAF